MTPGRVLLILSSALLALCLIVSAALVVGSMALLEDQIIGLRQDVEGLVSRVDDLQKGVAGIRADSAQRQSFEQSGPCSPEINRLIIEAWEGSSQAIPLDVVQRLVWRESRCQSDAVSSKDARGLLQVRPLAAMSLGYAPEAMLNPETGLMAGIEYLELMLAMSNGDLEEALTRYHVGPSRYDEVVTPVAFARNILGGRQ